MKKFFTLVVLALLAVGCAKEYDDTGVRELIAGLDLRVSELEANVSALQSALGDGKFVRKVEEYKGENTSSLSSKLLLKSTRKELRKDYDNTTDQING